MRIIRGKIQHPKVVPHEATIGDWPFVRCECGEWVQRDNPEVHMETVSLDEFLAAEHAKPARCLKRRKP